MDRALVPDYILKQQTQEQKPLLKTTCRACGRIFEKVDDSSGSSICPCGSAISIEEDGEWKLYYSTKKLLF